MTCITWIFTLRQSCFKLHENSTEAGFLLGPADRFFNFLAILFKQRCAYVIYAVNRPV